MNTDGRMRPGGGGREGWARPMGGGGPMGMVAPGEKPKRAQATLRRLLACFRPHLAAMVLVAVAAIASTVFTIISPKILGNITTDLYAGFLAHLRHLPGGGVDFARIADDLLILTAVYVASTVFSWVQQYVMAGVSQRVVYALRRQVMAKLGRLPVRFFDHHPHGEVMSRFVNDFDNISSTLQQGLTQIVTAVITFVGVVVMMLTISPVLTLAIALTLPLSLLVTRVIAVRSQRLFLTRQRELGALNGHVEEMYGGHTIVKAYGQEAGALDVFRTINDRLYRATWKAQFATGVIMPLMRVIGNLGFVVVSVVGGILVARRGMPIGDIQAFIQYTRQFSQPITQIASISNSIQSALASAERVFELLDEPEEVSVPPSAQRLGAVRGDVAFEQVAFRYLPDRPLIDGLTLHVRAGQTVAIVGPTGAGKTTLVNLLMRFYDLDAGVIRIDGVDIATMARADVRRLFGMVLQDTWLFGGTIRGNIAYGLEGASLEQVVAASRAAHADHFIRTLPDGYDTVLNEEAANISQGQRQLLTIARAFLADPPMLILDEATSSVDTRTELAIQQAMAALRRGRTSFVIAHRLSTVRDADLILVMRQGRVVDQGTHAELVARPGDYRELYESQFSGQVAAGA